MPIRGFAKNAASTQRGFVATQPMYELGGLNEDENPQVLKPTDLVRADNCVRKGSLTGTRPGVAYEGAGLDYTAALTGTPKIQGIYEWRTTQDTVRKMIVVAGGNVYVDDSSGALDKSATVIASGATDPNLWTFADFQDKVWAAGGDPTTDKVWYWDGTGAAPGVLQDPALTFDAQYVFTKWNFLFLGGLTGTTYDDNPMVARYCDYATDATVAANWKTANVIPGQLLGENFGGGTYGSEYNTGFASYADNSGDFLLFLTNKRIVAFKPNENLTGNADAFRISDTVATGCVNQRAFVSLGTDVGDAVYLSEAGVHSLAQSQQYGNKTSEYLSWPIRKTFDNLNRSRLKYASGAYWKNEGLVLFAVATGSSTYNDTILCLDIKNANRLTPDTVRWYKWYLNGIQPNILVAARGADDKPYIYVGGTAGEVVRFERATYSDNSAAISCDFQTKHEDFGLPSREKHAGDLYVALQGGGNYTVQHTHVFDDGQKFGQSSLLPVPDAGGTWVNDAETSGTLYWGTGNWGSDQAVIRHRIPGVGSSPTISHRFSHSGAGEPFWVGLIDQEVFVSGPSDDGTANVTGG